MIYLIDLEYIPNRYTAQWRTGIADELRKNKFETVTISGNDYYNLTPGGFFDFNATNKYKSEQAKHISSLFIDGKIKNGDVFFFYDIWHPAVIQTKYMIDTSGIDAKIVGMLHAGAYDPADILGQKNLGRWCKGFEESIVSACDAVFFGSDFHINLYLEGRTPQTQIIYKTGWFYPLHVLDKVLAEPEIKNTKHKKHIVFPHRLSPEKHLEIFAALPKYLPADYTYEVTMEEDLSKEEYFRALATADIVFSAAEQETFGFSMMEGTYLGAKPIAPNSCSYPEMYDHRFLYDPQWIVNKDVEKIANFIESLENTEYPNDQFRDSCLTNFNNMSIIMDVIDSWRY